MLLLGQMRVKQMLLGEHLAPLGPHRLHLTVMKKVKRMRPWPGESRKLSWPDADIRVKMLEVFDSHESYRRLQCMASPG